MKKLVLAVLSMGLLATYAYADGGDNARSNWERNIATQAAASEQVPFVLKKDAQQQKLDAWTIRSNRENQNSRH